MQPMNVQGVGLKDGTQFALVTCACGAQFAARLQSDALAQHAAHAVTCTWVPPAQPSALPVAGISAAGAPLSPAQVSAAIGAPL